MLRHGGDDGNVDLGVGRVPERVETTSPGRDPAFHGKEHKSTTSKEEGSNERGAEDELELLGREVRAHELGECNKLQETKDTCPKNKPTNLQAETNM